jgi:hypothetical protein
MTGPGACRKPYLLYRGINKRILYENYEKRLLMRHAAFIYVYILNQNAAKNRTPA